MPKLTKELKAAIITKAMKGFMQKEKDEIEARRVALGIEVYELAYGAVEDKARSLGEHWVDLLEKFTLDCEGFQFKRPTVSLQGVTGFAGDAEDLQANMPLGRERPFPSGYSGPLLVVDEKHPLWAKSQKLVKDHRRIVQAEEDLRQKIWALLQTCNTDKQLAAAWPEAMDFLPKNSIVTTALVAVGLSQQINKALGIPPKASVATKVVRKAAAH